MISNDIIIYTIIGLIVWGFILYTIIQDASKSRKIELQMRIQSLLLGKMARKVGIDGDEIDKILEMKK